MTNRIYVPSHIIRELGIPVFVILNEMDVSHSWNNLKDKDQAS